MDENIEVYLKNGPDYWYDQLISKLTDDRLVNIMVGYICRRLWAYRDDEDLKRTKASIKYELRKRNLDLRVKYELRETLYKYDY